jgi:hypothetical protein
MRNESTAVNITFNFNLKPHINKKSIDLCLRIIFWHTNRAFVGGKAFRAAQTNP